MQKNIKNINYLFIIISIFTLIIFFIYSYSNYLNFILGKKYIFTEISHTFVCNNLDFYCRNLTYEFYKYIFGLFTNDPQVIFFFQLFLLSYSCYFLIEQLKLKKKNNFFKFFIFLLIFANPKVFKYCFSLTEESLFISLLVICLGLFIKIIFKYSFKKLFLLSFIIGVTYAIRPAGIFLFLLPLFIILKYYSLVKLKFLFIILVMFLPYQIDKIFFYKINSVHQPSFIWGAMLGKVPLFAKKINSKTDEHFEFQNILTQLNKKFENDLKFLNTHTLKQFHRNSTIELFKTSKVAGEIKIINDYFKNSEQHSNIIIKETFFNLLKTNYLYFIKELSLNYLGIWELRELLTKKNQNEYFNLIKKNKLNFSKNYDYILQSTNHPNVIVIFAKSFMLIFFTLNLYILLNYIVKFYKKNNKTEDDLLFYFILTVNFYFLIICISTNVQTRLILGIWPLISLTIAYFILNKFFQQYLSK